MLATLIKVIEQHDKQQEEEAAADGSFANMDADVSSFYENDNSAVMQLSSRNRKSLSSKKEYTRKSTGTVENYHLRWGPADDQKLLDLVASNKFYTGKAGKIAWLDIATIMNRTPEQCRTRWNYKLNPRRKTLKGDNETDVRFYNEENNMETTEEQTDTLHLINSSNNPYVITTEADTDTSRPVFARSFSNISDTSYLSHYPGPSIILQTAHSSSSSSSSSSSKIYNNDINTQMIHHDLFDPNSIINSSESLITSNIKSKKSVGRPKNGKKRKHDKIDVDDNKKVRKKYLTSNKFSKKYIDQATSSATTATSTNHAVSSSSSFTDIIINVDNNENFNKTSWEKIKLKTKQTKIKSTSTSSLSALPSPPLVKLLEKNQHQTDIVVKKQRGRPPKMNKNKIINHDDIILSPNPPLSSSTSQLLSLEPVSAIPLTRSYSSAYNNDEDEYLPHPESTCYYKDYVKHGRLSDENPIELLNSLDKPWIADELLESSVGHMDGGELTLQSFHKSNSSSSSSASSSSSSSSYHNNNNNNNSIRRRSQSVSVLSNSSSYMDPISRVNSGASSSSENNISTTNILTRINSNMSSYINAVNRLHRNISNNSNCFDPVTRISSNASGYFNAITRLNKNTNASISGVDLIKRLNSACSNEAAITSRIDRDNSISRVSSAYSSSTLMTPPLVHFNVRNNLKNDNVKPHLNVSIDGATKNNEINNKQVKISLSTPAASSTDDTPTNNTTSATKATADTTAADVNILIRNSSSNVNNSCTNINDNHHITPCDSNNQQQPIPQAQNQSSSSSSSSSNEQNHSNVDKNVLRDCMTELMKCIYKSNNNNSNSNNSNSNGIDEINQQINDDNDDDNDHELNTNIISEEERLEYQLEKQLSVLLRQRRLHRLNQGLDSNTLKNDQQDH